jgi:hypothetical protein
MSLGAGREDVSDVTPKFVLAGLGFARAAPGELGAGTPATEWRIRVALGPSHDEQSQTPYSVSNTTATGTGRYENFAIALRYPTSEIGSIEAAWNRRTHKSTDLLDIGQERFILSEQRVLFAERMDVAVGWRRRWKGFEAALSARAVHPSGSDTTAGVSHLTEGWIYGGALETRGRVGHWSLAAAAERASGRIGVHEENLPSFTPRDFPATATLEAYRIGLGYEAPKTEIFLQATYDRSHLPLVAFALLGTEVSSFESGYHPESRARLSVVDLILRRTLVPGFRAKIFLRSSPGDETLTLTDRTGVLPTRTLDVQRPSVVGGGFSHVLSTLGVGAEIVLPERN